MKADIHPKYYPNATVICSCGNTWTTGSTVPEIRTDVCNVCHPFYTGEQRIVDSAGQVDRFRKRLERYVSHQSEASRRQQKQQEKSWKAYLKQQLIALDLSDNVFQILSDADVITVNDLLTKVEKDEASLLALEGFTSDALKEVKRKLEDARTSILGRS